MVSSCCKNSVDKFETATLYKWIYYIPDEELKSESHAWYKTFDQCKEDALCNAQHILSRKRCNTSLHLQMDCGNSTNVVLQKTIDDITEE